MGVVRWNKPTQVSGYGLVYRSKCGKFYIDCRLGESGYRLMHTIGGGLTKELHHTLKAAKEAAELLAAL
jgi:hypothetical protein